MAKTTGTIDGSTISVIEGTAADVNTVYDGKGASDGFSGLEMKRLRLPIQQFLHQF